MIFSVLCTVCLTILRSVDPNIIDNNGLKLTFGSYWNGLYQIGLWPDVKTQASVRLIEDVQTAVSH